MVPGSDFDGSVAPISFLPYLITPSPSHTFRIWNRLINCNLAANTGLFVYGQKMGGFDYHGKHGTGAEEVAQSIEERPFLEIMVVLLGKLLGWNHQLDGNKLVSFSLESGHYL